MILFYFPQCKDLALKILKSGRVKSGKFNARIFPSGERQIRIQSDVRNKPCLILSSDLSDTKDLFDVLLLAHTLKKDGARRVEILLPYMSYTRSDKNIKGESWAAKWVGELFKASGVNVVTTVDRHSKRDRNVFPIPLKSIGSEKLFAETLRSLPFLKPKQDLSVVAPDAGAIDRCHLFARLIGIKKVGYFTKRRSSKGIKLLNFRGKVGKKAIIFDDILDTGRTLIECARKLKALGVSRIIVCVTHALFTREKYKRLFKLGVERIYCANSVARRPPQSSRIITLDISPLITTSERAR